MCAVTKRMDSDSTGSGYDRSDRPSMQEGRESEVH